MKYNWPPYLNTIVQVHHHNSQFTSTTAQTQMFFSVIVLWLLLYSLSVLLHISSASRAFSLLTLRLTHGFIITLSTGVTRTSHTVSIFSLVVVIRVACVCGFLLGRGSRRHNVSPCAQERHKSRVKKKRN